MTVYTYTTNSTVAVHNRQRQRIMLGMLIALAIAFAAGIVVMRLQTASMRYEVANLEMQASVLHGSTEELANTIASATALDHVKAGVAQLNYEEVTQMTYVSMTPTVALSQY